jgi:hypothetical protein
VKQGGKMADDLILVCWGTHADRDGWRVDYLQKSASGKYELVYGSDHPLFPVNVDQFGPIQEDLLLNALRAEFPDSKIRIELINRENFGRD